MRILTFNCHEAWVHQLGFLGADLDIVIGLAGRYTQGWDDRMRPVPDKTRLLSLDEVLQENRSYDCVIAHNITDLLESKTIVGPRIIVLHGTLEGRRANEQADVPLEQIKELLNNYLRATGGHAVAISDMKAKSWGLKCDIVHNGVDVDSYLKYDGSVNAGLRVCNQISDRQEILMWDFHQRAFGDLDIRLVGHNPDMPGVNAAENWDDLKKTLSLHRFYIHTADPHLEDGFNLAVLEAMAAGLPVLGNCHPTSIIEHGKSGFLSDDPDELKEYAKRLLCDRQLAEDMGKQARKIVCEQFTLGKFAKKMRRSIEKAHKKWRKLNKLAATQ